MEGKRTHVYEGTGEEGFDALKRRLLDRERGDDILQRGCLSDAPWRIMIGLTGSVPGSMYALDMREMRE